MNLLPEDLVAKAREVVEANRKIDRRFVVAESCTGGLIAAALTTIPRELYEAASLDGAGPVSRFRYITIPALRSTLLAVACLVTIYTMRAFDLIFAMTQGGPLDSSNVLPLLSYQFSFQQFQFGMGAAIGTFAFFICFAVALLYVRTLGKEAAA